RPFDEELDDGGVRASLVRQVAEFQSRPRRLGSGDAEVRRIGVQEGVHRWYRRQRGGRARRRGLPASRTTAVRRGNRLGEYDSHHPDGDAGEQDTVDDEPELCSTAAE